MTDGDAFLDERVIDAIAMRVAAILRREHEASTASSPRMVGAEEIAEMFSVSRKWVYDNATSLGAVKLGNGPKPRLRFDPEHVRKILAGPPKTTPARSRGRRPRRWIDEAELIPISN